MATYFRLLDVGRQFFDNNGDLLTGGKLYTYEAGTTTNKTTYQDDAGAASHTNPIILDSSGRASAEVWGTTGAYKFKLTTSADSEIWVRDDITGVNDTAQTSASEWIASGLTPTYVSATQFTFAGDQTTTFHSGRRLKTTDSGGTDYATITSSSYADPTTTINVLVDSGSLDSGLSAVSYGVVSKSNSSFAVHQLLTKQATTSGRSKNFAIPSWAREVVVHILGVSTSGTTDTMYIRLGVGGADETSGYLSASVNHTGTVAANGTAGFDLTPGAISAANVWQGQVRLSLADASTNTWSAMWSIGTSNLAALYHGAGVKPLAGTLNQVSLALAGSTDSLDAGNVAVSYY